eukprot:CAMPEP_0194029868 /NCGR_PEP_ID=MMETSP0009_2-20130614/3495_1 /TAXON_ID=210454 /ORGANISM="Grammatophora oceanica, Strain CCMP 410" /LENGTH=79 /DNA_ID=CAMNT_0038669661 /DNA_START=356 /DNA_END=596 /DNA_ORIENTATION=+
MILNEEEISPMLELRQERALVTGLDLRLALLDPTQQNISYLWHPTDSDRMFIYFSIRDEAHDVMDNGFVGDDDALGLSG